MTRPLIYYPCLSGWTLVIWEFIRRWWDANLLTMPWLYALGYLAVMFWGGMVIGLGAFLANESIYRGLMRLQGREIP